MNLNLAHSTIRIVYAKSNYTISFHLTCFCCWSTFFRQWWHFKIHGWVGNNDPHEMKWRGKKLQKCLNALWQFLQFFFLMKSRVVSCDRNFQLSCCSKCSKLKTKWLYTKVWKQNSPSRPIVSFFLFSFCSVNKKVYCINISIFVCRLDDEKKRNFHNKVLQRSLFCSGFWYCFQFELLFAYQMQKWRGSMAGNIGFGFGLGLVHYLVSVALVRWTIRWRIK